MHIKLLHLIILISVLLGLVACSSEKQSTYLLVENQLESDFFSPKSLYKISTDGSHIELLYDLSGLKWYWFSPNFEYIAFAEQSSDNENPYLNITHIQTKQVVGQIMNLHPYIDSVVWNSTSDKLLIYKSDPLILDRNEWWVYDINNHLESRLITEDNASINLFPSWSIDSQYVAYVSRPCSNNICHQNQEAFWDIKIIDMNSKVIRLVTNFSTSSIPLLLGSGDEIFCNLQWSLNQKYIAFENQCKRGDGPIDEKHRVFVVNLESMIIQEVFQTSKHYAYGYLYKWTETNKLFMGYTQANSYDFRTFFTGGIILYDPLQNGSIQKSAELLGFSGNDIHWTTDNSKFLAFTREPIFTYPPQGGQLYGSGAILLGNFENGNLTIWPESGLLPYGLCYENEAYWSENGEDVAFSSPKEQYACNEDLTESDVYIYSLSNKQLINITETLPGISKPLGWITPNN